MFFCCERCSCSAFPSRPGAPVCHRYKDFSPHSVLRSYSWKLFVSSCAWEAGLNPVAPQSVNASPPPPAGPLTTQSSANVPRQPDIHTPYHSPPLQHRVAFGLKLRKSLIRLVQTGGSASRLTQDEQFQIPILRTLAITWVHKCDDIGQGLP